MNAQAQELVGGPSSGTPNELILSQLVPSITDVRVGVTCGGTGGYAALRALAPIFNENLSGLINAFDNGGSTGKLRDTYPGLIAIGDIRQAIGAMSTLGSEVVESFNSRYSADDMPNNPENVGHARGNLKILEAYQAAGGDIVTALQQVSAQMGVEGAVLPVSSDSRHIRITTPDGVTVIDGEHETELTQIASLKGANISFYENIDGHHEDAEAELLEEARLKIIESDIMIVGPGDTYTSLGPNLAVNGMKEALSQSKRVIHFVNIMNRNVHTVGFDALDFVNEYHRILGARVIDTVVFNTRMPDEYALKEQAKKGSYPVEVDESKLINAGYNVIGTDMLLASDVKVDPNDKLATLRSSIRHDPVKIGRVFAGIAKDDKTFVK